MRPHSVLTALLLTATAAYAGVEIDLEVLGKSLGGWNARKGKAAEYEIAEAGYRTYQPEISPSPDGGIFVSIRIDHRRGFMSSDDHASLELSFAPDGTLVSAQSSLALQGRTITSELIRGGAAATTGVAAPQIDRAVRVGTDLVADLSSKLLREKIVEPGRVSFPAAIRHNYNLLYQAVRVRPDTPDPEAGTPPATMPTNPATPPPVGAPGPGGTPNGAAGIDSGTSARAPTAPATPKDREDAAAIQAPASIPPGKSAVNGPLLPVRQPAPPPAAQSAPKSTAPAAAPTKPPMTHDARTKKEVPLPDIKPYNPAGAPTTPIPPKAEQSLLLKYGDDVLKIARDVVRDGQRR